MDDIIGAAVQWVLVGSGVLSYAYAYNADCSELDCIGGSFGIWCTYWYWRVLGLAPASSSK